MEEIYRSLLKYNVFTFIIAICTFILCAISIHFYNENRYKEYLLLEKQSYIMKFEAEAEGLKKLFCRTNDLYLKCNKRDNLSINLSRLYCKD